MSFIETLFSNLQAHPEVPFIRETHGTDIRDTSGSGMSANIGRIRHTLRTKGVKAGSRVVLVAPNSALWVAADLAILAEGAISVPMYARQDVRELVAMMRDCKPRRVIVATDALKAAIKAEWARAPLMTFNEVLHSEQVVTDPPLRRTSDDVATIIYTSGTSGEPKGVMLTVGNIDHMLPVTRDHLDTMMGPREGDDRVFHYLPFCFAGSRVVLWTCLFRSNPLFVSTDLDNLPAEMSVAKPNYFLNVPVLLERIKNKVEEGVREKPKLVQRLYDSGKKAFAKIQAGEDGAVDRLKYALAKRVVYEAIRQKIGPNLRCLICGSAPLGEDTQHWFMMLGIPVYQVYGLTETTAIATMDRPPETTVPGWVGLAIPGVQTKVTSEGELLLKGPNIFPGYWDKKDITETAFIDGWFRTGDQVELDADGRVKVIGRVGNLLVPSSGHNVAPEPIEQRMVETIEGAEHVVVIGHGKPYLTAIITGNIDESTLQASLDAVNTELPHYRRVRKHHVCEELLTIENGLLTATSKLKRSAIAAHFADAIAGMYA
ncbi:MAG: long-chain acyl-CoA synthetase [Myxococcota bacterium]|jgi:long-chain acyl-CoA synthetase